MSLTIPPSKFSLKPVLLAAGLGLAAVGGAFAGSQAAIGGDGAERPHHERGNPADRMAERLQLDESQKAKVSAIFERNRPAQQKLRERGKAHWQAMKALKPGSPDYGSRSQALADEAGTLARDRVLSRTQLKAELATVLTPAQMEKMQEHHDKMRGGRRWHGRGGKGGEGGASPDTES
ncbi:MAG: Spy/CpxP family protein refolding chaperone [Panacagrimonas sp.]